MQQTNYKAKDIDALFEGEQSKSLLRFITCGSVDDGKSTLIGRLLYDSQAILEDQLKILADESKKFKTTDTELDFALLVDGLAAEREQGITIDVAYRFFSTDKRKFIIADTPGHEQYTRNMATGASTADLAIVLVDARKGVLTQTRRHSLIASMLGVKNIVLAVNKMDLVNYSQQVFKKIVENYQNLANILGINNFYSIPISALCGDNLIHKVSTHTPWYTGLCLLEYLETLPLENEATASQSFCMPVQWINRPHLDFRGFSGTISSGVVQVGDLIKVLPSGKASSVSQIVTYDGQLSEASKGQAVTLILKDEIDVSRGNVLISASEESLETADQFEANVIWMAEKEMVPHRQYIIQLHKVSALCTLSKPKYRLNIQSFERIASKSLYLNEIGVCDIALNKLVAFTSYTFNKELGSFILIDRMTHETVAAGMITHALRRSTNIHRQHSNINEAARSFIKQQKPYVLWLTGLSGGGKSTIANLVEEKLNAMGKHTMLLDGDNLRLGLNKDLGFTDSDRIENIRRVAEVSKLMADAGLIILVSLISPFKAEREMAKELIGKQKFVEIFVDTPLAEAEARDIKGLYKKAHAGEIPNFTGIGSPYEPPEVPDIKLDTMNYSSHELADYIISFLLEKGYLQ
ncbi:MAG: sulfate adenylyltransferase subunit CysN [Alphaproteobacteria bacterium]|nr:sulfate adenylyltransferase subunit CysN [Alphaproteobacteria bacterium]